MSIKLDGYPTMDRPSNRTRYDWGEVQRFIDAGGSRAGAVAHFGFTDWAWQKAINRGQIRYSAPDRSAGLKRSLEDGDPCNRRNLKAFIIKNDLIPYVCAECGTGPEWNGKPLVLQLEHKNGVSDDNRLENLEFLCPNCHSQTETFAGRNARRAA